MTGQNKVISYCLFGSRSTEKWLFNTYARGLYFNVLMNKLIYPDWISHVEIDSQTYSDYDNYINWLNKSFGMTFNINPPEPLCKAMLWRLKPVFNVNNEVVLCRDADSITTHRESVLVKRWLCLKHRLIMGINDNSAHNLPLMGGMVGFNAQLMRNMFLTWDYLILKSNKDLSKHGSDQDFLMNVIFPLTDRDTLEVYVGFNHKSDQINPLWESDLTCRHIGSPGVVEMETIRFFQRRNMFAGNEEISKRYPQIFNWMNL